MRRRRNLSRKDRRAFDRLVRMFYEFEARDPAAGETGPPTPRLPGAPGPRPPLRRRGDTL